MGPSEGQLYVEREGKAEKVCEWEEDRVRIVVLLVFADQLLSGNVRGAHARETHRCHAGFRMA